MTNSLSSRWLTVTLLAIICITWIACTQQRQPCMTPKTATLIINSIHFASDTATIPVDSLLPGGTFIPVNATNPIETFYPPASLFGISLSSDSTICQWAMQTDTATHTSDTLTFFYKKNPQFISNACGFTYFFSVDSIHTTHVFIDSVHIINPGVTNVTNNVKNVQIYIKRNF